MKKAVDHFIKEVNWKSYSKPKIFKEFEAYFKLKKHADVLYNGFTIFFVDYKYLVRTPLDVITFAATGGDGNHFGFLTDFGNKNDLSNAPIVHIESHGVTTLVARNFKDFWKILLFAKDAELNLSEDDLYLLDAESNWSDILEEMEEDEPGFSDKRMESYEKAKELLKEEFGIGGLKNPAKYKEDFLNQRKSEANIQTTDGLGIIYDGLTEVINEFNYTDTNIQNIKQFLTKANRPSRVKFYRDATHNYILSGDDQMKDCISKFLTKDGFIREAELLKLR